MQFLPVNGLHSKAMILFQPLWLLVSVACIKAWAGSADYLHNKRSCSKGLQKNSHQTKLELCLRRRPCRKTGWLPQITLTNHTYRKLIIHFLSHIFKQSWITKCWGDCICWHFSNKNLPTCFHLALDMADTLVDTALQNMQSKFWLSWAQNAGSIYEWLASWAQKRVGPGNAYIWFPDNPSNQPLYPPLLFFPLKNLLFSRFYSFIQVVLNGHTQCARTREEAKEVEMFLVHSDCFFLPPPILLLLKLPLCFAWVIAVAIVPTDIPLYILSFLSWKPLSGFVSQSKSQSPHHDLYDPRCPCAMFVWNFVLPPVPSLHWLHCSFTAPQT